MLLEEEWREPAFSNKAFLDGREPDLELQYAVLDEIVRFHIRLFRYRGLIIGNIHLDVVPMERVEDIFRVLMGRPHKSNHVIGVDYLSGLFLRRGYIVEVKKEPLLAKIFKSRTQCYVYMKIVKSRFYDSVAVSHGGRTVVITPTTITIFENGKFATYRIRNGQLESLKNPSDTPLLFVPEPGVTPDGFIREIKDGKLYAKRGNVIIEVGEIHEI